MDNMSQKVRLGTRGSALALKQANWVAARLQEVHAGLQVELSIIKTSGDRITDAPLSSIGGKSLFTKEIEVALLERKIDLAVHSMKDLPVELPAGLCVGAVPEREDPHDCLIIRPGLSLGENVGRGIQTGDTLLDALPEASVVGTSSLRRKAQLLHRRPDLTVENLRGNVDTRVRKVCSGQYDAIILAVAGLRRMGWTDIMVSLLPYSQFLPAPGQGALAIECREDDKKIRSLLQPLDHTPTHNAVRAERQLLLALGGGCQVPIAAVAEGCDGSLRLEALVCSLDGREVVREALVADGNTKPEAVGEELARRLLSRGAAAILKAIRDEPTLSPAAQE